MSGKLLMQLAIRKKKRSYFNKRGFPKEKSRQKERLFVCAVSVPAAATESP